jgi:hypothetical protein
VLDGVGGELAAAARGEQDVLRPTTTLGQPYSFSPKFLRKVEFN